MPRHPTVLISGASIAGPSLALWLARGDFDVTLVEKAPSVRCGGQAVDFKGATHRTVLDRMGILDAVLAARAVGGGDGAIVDANGRRIGTVPAAFGSGEIEIARGDLVRILFERTAGSCEYIFGDSVASLVDTAGGVEVGFQRSAPRVFDLVVGADGIHSNVRGLVFGPESDHVVHLGYHYALADIRGDAGCADAMYNEPGRMVATGGTKAPTFFVFASPPLNVGRDDIERQKQMLIAAFRGSAWRVPQLLDEIPTAENFYLDAISRVTTDRYAKGRVVLLGDAAYGNALGGFGTGLAVVGAYVLAAELSRANGDFGTAFARYAARFRGYAKVSQKVNAGKLLAPTTRLGLYARNRLFSVAPLFAGLMKLIDRYATDIELDVDD